VLVKTGILKFLNDKYIQKWKYFEAEYAQTYKTCSTRT